MMLVADLVSLFEQYAPSLYQESYDNTGLLLGDPQAEVKSVLLSVDVTEALLDEAIAGGDNVVVAHHPLIFSGVKKITPENEIGRCIIKAIRHQIALLAVHTNLDNIAGGVSYRMAAQLGLSGISMLAPLSAHLYKLCVFVPEEASEQVRNALFEAGAGSLGTYDACSFNTTGQGTFRAGEKANPYVGKPGELHREDEVKIEVILPAHLKNRVVQSMRNAHPYEEVAYDLLRLENTNDQVGSGALGCLDSPVSMAALMARIKQVFQVQAIRHSPADKEQVVKKIALCGGSGSHLIPAAKKQGVDVFISADIKYHHFFEADNNMTILDIGHFESEQCTKEIFYEILSEKKCNFAVRLAKTNTNPIEIS